MKTTLRVTILMAIIVATMGTVSADHSSAQAAMSAAARQRCMEHDRSVCI